MKPEPESRGADAKSFSCPHFPVRRYGRQENGRRENQKDYGLCGTGTNFASLTNACPSGLNTKSTNSTTGARGLPRVNIYIGRAILYDLSNTVAAEALTPSTLTDLTREFPST